MMNDDQWKEWFRNRPKLDEHYGKGPRKLNPRPSEIEDEDPIKAGRGGACHLALEVLLDFYPTAQPFRLTTEEEDGFDHVFLMLNNEPLDIRGFTTIDELRKWYRNGALDPVATTLEQIQQKFGHDYHCSRDEARKYKNLFRHFVEAHRHDLFPERC
jgi:hypothetical protein